MECNTTQHYTTLHKFRTANTTSLPNPTSLPGKLAMSCPTDQRDCMEPVTTVVALVCAVSLSAPANVLFTPRDRSHFFKVQIPVTRGPRQSEESLLASRFSLLASRFPSLPLARPRWSSSGLASPMHRQDGSTEKCSVGAHLWHSSSMGTSILVRSPAPVLVLHGSLEFRLATCNVHRWLGAGTDWNRTVASSSTVRREVRCSRSGSCCRF
ncbi:hypothetical protein BJ875DRAFT_254779 [Amylocarpus encephaloides]|uniref:Uncharacterized protein n=1 Tax=Amylocarpus encephaloides TaxID=45428 RepID=A0A9P8BZA1_9HELO|nr:hypothetical protein BJ875DRAFT_254779 [Amylocarpus encephaloides]